VVLVAQSMGAFTAPLVCSRLPVTELAPVNATIPSPGETAGDWWANTGQKKARRLGLTPEVLPGGHLVALSRPEELALAITERA
jgi:hypothetical protein